MDELSQLLNKLVPTENELVFAARPFSRNSSKPLFLSIIGPSGAGKDTIKNKLLHTGKFYPIKTATNRLRRKDENENEYFWMRQRMDGEPESAYLRHLIKEYNLLEYNYHYGNMYGTPLESLRKAFSSGKIPMYCSENQGALFMEKTLSKIADVLTIMVVPDNLEDMEKRILHGDRDNPTKRLKESIKKIKEAPLVAHYVVVNPSTPREPGKSGLESAVSAVKSLLSKLIE